MNTRARTGLLLSLLAAAISGVSIFVNGYGVRAVGNAAVYTTAKNAVAAVLLVAFVILAHARRDPSVTVTRPRGRAQWLGLTAVAVIGGSVAFVLFFDGLSQASSTQAAFVQKTLVVWVSILAVVVLGERIGLLQVGAVALLVLGQAMLAGPLTKVVTMPWGRGETEILVATLLWAVEVVIAKRLLAGMTSWTVGVARMAGGSVLLIGWLAVTGSVSSLARLDGTQWAWVMLTGLMLAAYVATWFAALARARAVDVTAVLVVGAPVTALLAAGVQHVSLLPQLGGLLVLLAGAGIVVARMARPPATVPVRR